MRARGGTERGRRRNFLFLEFLRFSFNPLRALVHPSFFRFIPFALSLSLFLSPTLLFSSSLLSPVFSSRLEDELWRPLNVEGTYRGLHRGNNDSTAFYITTIARQGCILNMLVSVINVIISESGESSDKYGRCY